jgi:hypothetical protein
VDNGQVDALASGELMMTTVGDDAGAGLHVQSRTRGRCLAGGRGYYLLSSGTGARVRSLVPATHRAPETGRKGHTVNGECRGYIEQEGHSVWESQPNGAVHLRRPESHRAETLVNLEATARSRIQDVGVANQSEPGSDIWKSKVA